MGFGSEVKKALQIVVATFNNGVLLSRSLLRSTGRRLDIALVVLGLLAALMFGMWQVDTKSSEYRWEPSNGDQSGKFILTRGWPALLEMEADCREIHSLKPGLLFSSGGIRVTATNATLRVQAPEFFDEGLEVTLPPAPCQASLTFHAESGLMTLSAGSETAYLTLPGPLFPRVTELFSGGEDRSAVDHVSLRTKPWGLESSVIRMTLGVLAVLLSMSGILLRWRGQRTQRKDKSDGGAHTVAAASTWSVAMALIVVAVVVPPMVDDGWVLTGIRHFRGNNVFSSLYDVLDSWAPLANFHPLLLKPFVEMDLPFVGLRLIIVAVIVVSWVILKRYVLVRLLQLEAPAIWAAGATFVLFSSAWLVSLRFEPWIVLYASISWAGFASYRLSGRHVGLFLALAGSGAAVSTHLTGWVTLPTAVAALVLALRQARASRTGWSDIGTSVVAAFSITWVQLFILYGPSTVAEAAADFGNNSGLHSSSVFSEAQRYRDLLITAPAARVATVMMLGVLLAIAALAMERRNRNSLIVWTLAFGSLPGLLATNSKWIWHFGVYAVPATIFAGLAISRVRRSGREVHPSFLVSIPVLMVVAAISSTFAGSWGVSDVVLKPWTEFVDRFGAISNESLWIGLIVLSLVVAAIADMSRRRGAKIAGTASLMAVLLCVPVMSFSWIVSDALQSTGWSYPRQHFSQLFGDNGCDDPRFVNDINPLVVDAAPADVAPLVRGAFPVIPSLEAFPAGSGGERWGTWSENLVLEVPSMGTEVDPTSAVGTFATPEYRLDSADHIAVAFASGRVDGVGFSMDFFSRDRDVVESVRLEPGVPDSWQMRIVGVPDGAVTARLTVTDESTEIGGWGAVSAVRRAELWTSSQVREEGTVFVGPFEGPKYPCLPLSRPEGGVWPVYSFVPEDVTFFGHTIGSDIPVASVGCIDPGTTCLGRPDYQGAEVVRRDL